MSTENSEKVNLRFKLSQWQSFGLHNCPPLDAFFNSRRGGLSLPIVMPPSPSSRHNLLTLPPSYSFVNPHASTLTYFTQTWEMASFHAAHFSFHMTPFFTLAPYISSNQ